MKQKKKLIKDYTSKNIRIVLLLIYDALAIFLAEELALLARFDFSYSTIEEEYLAVLERYTPVNILICLICFACMRLYSSLWEYASVQELVNVVVA